MKLISMTDFAIYYAGNMTYKDHSEKCTKYAKFIKQPLTLGMFVPCDEDGNVLKEQEEDHHFMYANGLEFYPHQKEEYYIILKKAKERVLFEHSFIYEKGRLIKHKKYLIGDHYPELIIKNKTIEYLIDCNITLTPNAIKQLGL